MRMCLVVWALGLVPPAAEASPLSLAEAVATALKQNPSVRAALSGAQAAQARVGLARSPWLPQLNANAQVRADSSYQTGVTAGAEAVNTLRYSGGLQLSQLVYDFGRTSARIAGAEAGTLAAIADSETTRSQVALRAIASFYSVLQAEALRDVSRRTLEQQQQRRLQSESFFRIGTRPEIDVLIARTAVANAELALVQADNAVWIARTQLLEALGIQSDPEPGATQERAAPSGVQPADEAWLSRPLQAAASPPLPQEAVDPQVDTLLDGALQNRPDYQAQRERVRQAEATVRALRGDYLPQLSLGLNGQLSGSIGGLTVGTVGGTSRLDVPTAGQPGFAVTGSLSLSWPILSGLSTVYGLREAHANLLAARATLDALRLSLRSQLLSALYQLRAAVRSVQAARALSAQADRQLEMARGRYQAGVGSAIELGDAAVTAASAQGQRVQAEYALYSARATLLWHIGQLIPTLRPLTN
ncbi:MAG: TolC family protein [Myxococcales bacterium]|nr:TolC family protein [Myxococcales bacterium]